MATHISLALVFVEGLVSFLSPCVLPIIPIYMGYLAGNSNEKRNSNKKVLLFTISFIFGILLAIFLMNASINLLQSFLKEHMTLFVRIGGILIVLLGIYQLGFIKINFLQRTFRFSLKTDNKMNVMVAFIMGFTFSFAWTPCVGPALTSVLIMAASASTKLWGFLLIGVYTIGFVLPFLAVGLFTTKLLEFFKAHVKVVKYTAKIGGVLMIFMGILMFTGKMNAVTGYLSSGTPTIAEEQKQEEQKTEAAEEKQEENTQADGTGEKQETENRLTPAIDFTLTDQYGNTHKLSDYKGKTVFLNFWATWCSPCRAEMPDIQKLYESAETEGENALVVLGVAAPNMGNEKSEEEIKAFLEENGYTYPVLMDTTGEVFMSYGVNAFPTTFMITREGEVFGYASGQLNEETIKSIVEQTMSGKRK